MSLFNEEQMDHMRDLAKAAKKGLICPCGRFSKEDCARRCQWPGGVEHAEADKAARVARLAKAGGENG